MSRRLAAAAAVLTLTVTLTACATSDAGSAVSPDRATTVSSQAASTTHNAADAQFAQMMIVHHEGAIEMAELAIDAASTAEVKALGERIAAAQQPEIDQMTAWLRAWGEPGPPDMSHAGMDHRGMDMDGMDQAGAVTDLERQSGVGFDRRFLELMIAHHAGAIEMSEAELARGRNADALALARTIIDAQTAEIAEMTNLLGGL